MAEEVKDYYVVSGVLGGSTIILVHNEFKDTQETVLGLAKFIIDHRMSGPGMTDEVRRQLHETLCVRTRKDFTTWLRRREKQCDE